MNKQNILVVGAMGCGKSSTVNALLGKELAKIGDSISPETCDILSYEGTHLMIWDTFAYGEEETDGAYITEISAKLQEKKENGQYLVDVVLLVLDSSSRDLGTSYDLMNQMLVPHGKERILLGLNQCDMAMKGRHWDYDANEPEEKLLSFLEEKVISVQNRMKEATGFDFEAVFYGSGAKEKGENQEDSYNIPVLLEKIQAFQQVSQVAKSPTIANSVVEGNWWQKLKSRRKRKKARRKERAKCRK